MQVFSGEIPGENEKDNDAANTVTTAALTKMPGWGRFERPRERKCRPLPPRWPIAQTGARHWRPVPRQTLPRPMAIAFTRSEEPASSETDGKRSFVFLSRFLLSARHAPSPETGRARDRGNPPHGLPAWR